MCALKIRREGVGVTGVAAAGAGAQDPGDLLAPVEISDRVGRGARGMPTLRHAKSSTVKRSATCSASSLRGHTSISVPSQSAIWCWPSGHQRRNSREPFALRAGHRRWRQPRVAGGDALDVLLERLDAFDLEADVIHALGDDAGALIGGDVPRHDDQRDMAVGEVMVRIAGVLFFGVEIEHVAIELRHLDRVHGAHADVVDVPGLALPSFST